MYNRVKELHSEGYSQRAIARELEINRRTVAKLLKADPDQVESNNEKPVDRVSGFEVAKEYIEERLNSAPKIRKSVLYRQVMHNYPDISLSERAFCNYVNKLQMQEDPVDAYAESSTDTLTDKVVDKVEEVEKRVGERIAKYRLKAGLSKRKLAEKISVTPPLITYYEQGNRIPSLRTIIRISDATNVPVEYYLSDNEYVFESLSDDTVFTEKVITRTKKSRKNRIVPKVIDNIEEMFLKATEISSSEPDQCIEIGKRVLQKAKIIKYDVGVGAAYSLIGTGNYHHSRYYEALKNYFFAESIYKKERYYSGLRTVYNNIGSVYLQFNDLEAALKYYQKNLNLEAQASSPTVTSAILNNIGSVYGKLKQIDKALQYYRDALDVCEKHNLLYWKTGALNNIGKAFFEKGDMEKAERYMLKSLAVSEQIKSYTGLSYTYANLSDVKTKQEEFKTALTCLEKSLQFARKVDNQYLVANVYLKSNTLYEKMNNQEERKKNLVNCIAIAEPNDLRALALSAYMILSQIYEEEDDLISALRCYKKIQQIKDFLSEEKRTRAIEEIRTKLEVERTEKEKNILRSKNIELQRMNETIVAQKEQLERAERELKELNHNLELKVIEEIKKRRRQEQIVIQKSKLESLGQMAAGIAHEINQPLGLINMATQNLFHKHQNRSITKEYLIEKSSFVYENITRIKKIIEHVRLFSRDQKDSKNMFNIVDTLDDAISMINTQCRNNNIEIVKKIESSLPKTMGNRYRLEQVFLNLLANAKDALGSKFDDYDIGKQITLNVYTQEDKIITEIRDNGCGIDKEMIPNIFEPFYTTKEETKGTGLGLSICYGIINDMGGKITVDSKKGAYTVVKIELQALSETVNMNQSRDALNT